MMMTPRQFFLIADAKRLERKATKEAIESGGKKKLSRKTIDRQKKLMEDRQAILDIRNADALEALKNG